MSSIYQGDLANMWAVGGKQAGSANAECKYRYYRFCPGCGWQLTGKFSTCPRCGADLRMKECPYCRGMIPEDSKVCLRCTAQQSDCPEL